jgi:FkbM family methyltransferase
MRFLKFFFVKTISAFSWLLNFYIKLAEKIFPGMNSVSDDSKGVFLNLKKVDIIHILHGKKIPFSFYIPNHINRIRAETFSTKEPETLEWIDKYALEGGVLFDIGANVGLYSIYHAKTKKGITYSFEPSVFNLKLLVKNINLNNCQGSIKIIPNPLTSTNMFANFNLQSIEEGGALSSFGVEYGHDGQKMNIQTSYKTLGFSLDYLFENKLIEHVPSLIKIDVDGIEHLILLGAKKVLADSKCRSVLIEVNETFEELASEVKTILTDCGFMLIEKRTADTIEGITNFTYNQIWVKP